MSVVTEKNSLDVEAVRKSFPVLERRKYGKPLVYFDNAASTQKPSRVIDRVGEFYRHGYSNIHRGPHFLSEEAPAACEGRFSRAVCSASFQHLISNGLGAEIVGEPPVL